MRGATRIRTAWYRLRYRRVLTLGTGVHIAGTLRISGDGRVVLGDGVRVASHNDANHFHVVGPRGRLTIGPGTYVNGLRAYASEPIEVGPRCLLGGCWMSTSDFHSVQRNRHDPDAPVRTGPIRIGENVWLANRSAVLRGVTVGDDSVVGFGTVVTGDVPAGVVVGAAAQVTRPLPEAG